MPKILITGNGFDLKEHLPTKYSDFLVIINHILNSHDLDANSIYNILETYTEIEENYDTNFELDKKLIAGIDKIARDNHIFEFFKDEFEVETWIDFENRIEYLIKLIFDYCRLLNKNLFDKGPLGKQKGYYDSRLFDNNIEIPGVLCKFGIIAKEGYDYSLNVEYFNEKFDYYTGINYNKIAKDAYLQLMEFSDLFNLYIQTFVVPLLSKRKSSPKSIFSRFDRHFTFNYTPTFENFYDKNIKTHYLHGNSNNDNHNIVLGIDNINIESINEPAFLKFTKYYQKFSKKTDYYFLNELSEKEKNENFEFYFWGHSLDRSDADYLNEVFDFISNLKQTVKRIIVVYHSEASRENLLLNLFSVRGKKDIEFKIRNKELLFLPSDSKELYDQINSSIKKPDIRMFY